MSRPLLRYFRGLGRTVETAVALYSMWWSRAHYVSLLPSLLANFFNSDWSFLLLLHPTQTTTAVSVSHHTVSFALLHLLNTTVKRRMCKWHWTVTESSELGAAPSSVIAADTWLAVDAYKSTSSWSRSPELGRELRKGCFGGISGAVGSDWSLWRGDQPVSRVQASSVQFNWSRY